MYTVGQVTNTSAAGLFDVIAPSNICVISLNSCYSMVGRVGGRQKISIGRGCDQIGVVVHEIGEWLRKKLIKFETFAAQF